MAEVLREPPMIAAIIVFTVVMTGTLIWYFVSLRNRNQGVASVKMVTPVHAMPEQTFMENTPSDTSNSPLAIPHYNPYK